MTAIAGLVGVPPAGARERACQAALEAQRLYGSRRSIRSTADTTFGLNLHEILPEDRFDRQPYADGRFLLVADVRLDNRPEFTAALGIDASDAGQCSDAELLFRAWCRWEERCLDRIIGDYALAVRDYRSNKLYLARDPVGQRPLFYARVGGALFFASMPSGILPHGRFEHDRIRIAQRLAGLENETRRSYFDGITRILSGETIVFHDGRVETARWTPDTAELTNRRGDQLVVELRETLDKAVAARLRRVGGPIATHLSSGYDSSAVTATAAMCGDKLDIIAFTSAPVDDLATAPVWNRNVDESAIAAETARFLGIKHEIVRTPVPLLGSLRDHTRYFQEPVRNVLNMGWYAEIERRAAIRGAQVLLTGDLGNLSLTAGGLAGLSEWIRKRAFARWTAEAISAVRRSDVKWRGVLMASFSPFMPNWLNERLMHIFVGQPPWSSACFVRPEAYRQLPDQTSNNTRGGARERLEIMRGYDAGVFRKGSLAKHGIDERDPTADRRLIEFALRLPPEQLLHRGVNKPLARAALADRVPPFVLDLRIRGYQGADWVSRFDSASALAVLEEISANSTVQEVIDLPRLKRTIGDWLDPGKARALEMETFGRQVTNALAMGVFILESEDQARMGR